MDSEGELDEVAQGGNVEMGEGEATWTRVDHSKRPAGEIQEGSEPTNTKGTSNDP